MTEQKQATAFREKASDNAIYVYILLWIVYIVLLMYDLVWGGWGLDRKSVV